MRPTVGTLSPTAGSAQHRRRIGQLIHDSPPAGTSTAYVVTAPTWREWSGAPMWLQRYARLKQVVQSGLTARPPCLRKEPPSSAALTARLPIRACQPRAAPLLDSRPIELATKNKGRAGAPKGLLWFKHPLSSTAYRPSDRRSSTEGHRRQNDRMSAIAGSAHHKVREGPRPL